MLETFKQFLGTKERLPEKNIHYYVKWVSDCYRYFDVPASYSLTNEQNIEFINHLAKNHEDWQTQKPRDASHIIIPMEYVRGHIPVPRVRFIALQNFLFDLPHVRSANSISINIQPWPHYIKSRLPAVWQSAFKYSRRKLSLPMEFT